jgi:RNA polymerase sigma factor (sigma-70 family)
MGYEDIRLLEFLPWARNFARSCASNLPSHLDHDDLQSAGVLGYLRAASRYDATRGASFRGYCAVRIRGTVLDELRRWDWAPRSVHKNHRRITRITSNLTESLEREPTRNELATALGIEEMDLATFQTHSQPRQLVSLDEMTENHADDENLSLTERLADPAAASPDAGVLSGGRSQYRDARAEFAAEDAIHGNRPALSARRSIARGCKDARGDAFARLAVAPSSSRAVEGGLAAQPFPWRRAYAPGP